MGDLIHFIQTNILRYLTPTLLLPILFLAAIFCFFAYYWYAMAPREGTLEWVSMASRPQRSMTFSFRRHPMGKNDALPLLLITLAYALTAFWHLGSTAAPESFTQLRSGESVLFTLTEPAELGRIQYYPGLNTGSYTLEASADGESWVSLWAKNDDNGNAEYYFWADGKGYPPSQAMSQKYSVLFKWQDLSFPTPVQAKFFRLTGRPDAGKEWLELGELALYDVEGNRLSPTYVDEPGKGLFDEPEAVPDAPHWFNSGYFDEIYHPRTAYEHIRNVYPYEVTHPPLGKLIMGLGIRMFGMNPFGWRFMGTLFGVLMLPLLYIFLKNLFGKTVVAACGTCLFAFDFMHLTQTRIGTIDTYGVFFILAMYFFMYRYLTLPAGTPFHKGALPLFLSGLMWGIGISCKWTVIYGGIGLAVLYCIALYFKRRDWPIQLRSDGRLRPRFAPWLIKTLLFSVLCFIIIPLVIYTLSYLPYAKALGVEVTFGGTMKGFGDSLPVFFQNLGDRLSGAAKAEGYRAHTIPTDSLSGIMVNNQWYMFTYHEGVSQAHPYSSRWYQWIVDGRPILYYLDSAAGANGNLKAAFAAFNNPIVSWAGLLSVLVCAVQSFRRKWSKFAFFAVAALGAVTSLITVDKIFSSTVTDGGARALAIVLVVLGVLLFLALGGFMAFSLPQFSGKALFILVGYLSQLVPWLLIGRTTFAYHYFPSMLFLVLAISFVFNDLINRAAPHWRSAVYGLTGAAVGLYVLFYPVLVGIAVPSWYPTWFLQWLPSWPL